MRFPLPALALLAATLPMSPEALRAGGTAPAPAPAPVAEIAQFRAAQGVDDATLLAAARATQPFVEAAPGFVARHLSQGPDGVWTDYVLWRDAAAAEAAGKAFVQAPEVQPFMQAIDPDSLRMRHEAVRWSLPE